MHHLGFRNNIKERSASEDTKYSTIYDQERRKLISESGAGPEEVAKTLKPFSTVVSVMKNIGSKLRPKLPQCLKAIKIVGDWILTFNKLAIFLIYNAVFNRMLVFCSPDGLKCLAASTCWHADEKCVQCAHPNIWEAIKILQSQETTATLICACERESCTLKYVQD